MPQEAAEAMDAIQRVLERPAPAPPAPATPLGPATPGWLESQAASEALSTPPPPAQPAPEEATAEQYVLSDEDMDEIGEAEPAEEDLQQMLQAHKDGTASIQEAITAIKASCAKKARFARGARDAKRGLGGPAHGDAPGVRKAGAKAQRDK